MLPPVSFTSPGARLANADRHRRDRRFAGDGIEEREQAFWRFTGNPCPRPVVATTGDRARGPRCGNQQFIRVSRPSRVVRSNSTTCVSPGVVRCGVFLGDSVTRARSSVQLVAGSAVGGRSRARVRRCRTYSRRTAWRRLAQRRLAVQPGWAVGVGVGWWLSGFFYILTGFISRCVAKSLFANRKFFWRDCCLGSGRPGEFAASWRQKDE